MSISSDNVNFVSMSLTQNKRVTIAQRRPFAYTFACARDFLVHGIELAQAWSQIAGRHFRKKGPIVPKRMYTLSACLISPNTGWLLCLGSTTSLSTNVKCLCVLKESHDRYAEVSNCSLGAVRPVYVSG
jgi:hypothetical protein